jgi:glycosyltransferase involved in cell wall biosynthesis
MTRMGERRTRVLQLIGGLYIGGAEKVVASLALGIDRTRFDTIVCCTRVIGPLGDPIKAAGIPLVLSGSPSGISRYLGTPLLWRTLRKYRPDVIHSHGLPGMVELGPLSFLGVPKRWIHTYHYGNYPYANRRYMTIERIYSRQPDQLVAVAEAQRQTLIEHHRLDPARIVALPNGVRDLPFLQDAPAVRARKRQELGIPDEAPVVGSIAVLSEQKGTTYLLQAAKGIVDRVPGVRIVIVGDGPLKDSLTREAASLGLGDHVIFTGWRADVGELLMAFDVWVMASLWEAMPLALLEAMAGARPIVVTDVGDNRRVVQDGRVARVVPPRAVDPLRDAIIELVENRDEAQALGRLARTRFEERFTIGRMVESYEALYSTPAGEGPARAVVGY